jgi:hypothetical protein
MWTSLQVESSVITAILVVHDEFWAGPERSDRRPSGAPRLRGASPGRLANSNFSINGAAFELHRGAIVHDLVDILARALPTANARYAGDEYPCTYINPAMRP